MINFRLLRSRGTRENFLISFHRREKSSFSVKNCKLAAPLGFFRSFGPPIEKSICLEISNYSSSYCPDVIHSLFSAVLFFSDEVVFPFT